MALIFSQVRADLGQALVPERYARLCMRATDEVRRIVCGVEKAPPFGATGMSPQQAAEILNAVRAALEKHLEREAQHYSPLRWLWMIRRAPEHIFEGSYRTTAPYDRLLAETLGATSGARGGIDITNGQLTYPLKGAFATHLGLFCAKAVLLSDLHRQLRLAGKGSSFGWPKNQIIPFATPDDGLRRAVHRYDKRTENELGLADLGAVPFVEALSSSPRAIALVGPIAPTRMVVPFEGEQEAAMVARYFPRRVSARMLSTLYDEAAAAGVDWSDEVRLLVSAVQRVLLYIAVHRTGLVSTLDVGYLTGTRRFVAQWMKPVVHADDSDGSAIVPPLDISSDEMIARLATCRGTSWPLVAGPVIHEDGDVVCLDLVSLTARLSRVLSYPQTQGDVANVRGKHFEDAVQEAVDASPWRPTSQLRELRRRTLRIAGDDVTDLDAIGCWRDKLLLISCKSMLRTAEYDQGSHALVRNRAGAVVNAVNSWAAKCARLAATPIGDNYDLSAYSRPIGVVVTPTLFYVPEGEATVELAPGLLAACSFSELCGWLNRSQAT